MSLPFALALWLTLGCLIPSKDVLKLFVYEHMVGAERLGAALDMLRGGSTVLKRPYLCAISDFLSENFVGLTYLLLRCFSGLTVCLSGIWSFEDGVYKGHVWGGPPCNRRTTAFVRLQNSQLSLIRKAAEGRSRSVCIVLSHPRPTHPCLVRTCASCT